MTPRTLEGLARRTPIFGESWAVVWGGPPAGIAAPLALQAGAFLGSIKVAAE